MLGDAPYLREILCALTLIVVDLCALAVMLKAGRERKQIGRIWNGLSGGAQLTDGKTVISLRADEIIVGRHSSADIRLRDPSVSRYHAILTLSGGQWTITDLHSRAGLVVNGEPVKSARLRAHDQIQLGGVTLEFLQHM